MSTLRQAFWRLVRKRPTILFWAIWLRVGEWWCDRFHRAAWRNYDGCTVWCPRCAEERFTC